MSNTFSSSRAESDNHQCPLMSTEMISLCEQFALITNTNTDLAMALLQENEWNIEHAINAYLDKSKSTLQKSDEQHPTSSVSFFLNTQWNNFRLLSSQ